MTQGVTPPPSIPPVQIAGVTAYGTTTSATSIPAAIAVMPTGTLLRGIIGGRNPQGQTVLQTDKGDVALKTDIFFKRGAELMIRVEKAQNETVARIITVDGRSLAKYLESLSHALPQEDSIAENAFTRQQAAPPPPRDNAAANAAPSAPPAPVPPGTSTVSARMTAIMLSPLPLKNEASSLPPEIVQLLQNAPAGTQLAVRITQLTLPTATPLVPSLPPATLPLTAATGDISLPPAPVPPPQVTTPGTAPPVLQDSAAPAGQVLAGSLAAALPASSPAVPEVAPPLPPSSLPSAATPTAPSPSPANAAAASSPAVPPNQQGIPLPSTGAPLPVNPASGETAPAPLPLPPSVGTAPASAPASTAPSVPPASTPMEASAPLPAATPSPGAASPVTAAPPTPQKMNIPPSSPPSVASSPPPPAPAAAPPHPAPGTSSSTVAAPTVTATVLEGTTATGLTLHSPLGALRLLSPTPLPAGTQVQFTIEYFQPPATPLHTTMAAPSGESVKLYPALSELEELSLPISAPAVSLDTTLPYQPHLIPRPGKELTTELVFLMSALKGSDLRKWLGEDTLRRLSDTNPDLLKQIGTEFSLLRRSIGEEGEAVRWTMYQLPVSLNAGVMEPIRLYHRENSEKEAQDQETRTESGQHFIVDIELTRLGRLQLDGFVKKAAGKQRFDLVIRSESRLDSEMKQGIRDIYKDAGELTGFEGGISFLEGRDALFKLPTPASFSASEVSGQSIMV